MQLTNKRQAMSGTYPSSFMPPKVSPLAAFISPPLSSLPQQHRQQYLQNHQSHGTTARLVSRRFRPDNAPEERQKMEEEQELTEAQKLDIKIAKHRELSDRVKATKVTVFSSRPYVRDAMEKPIWGTFPDSKFVDVRLMKGHEQPLVAAFAVYWFAFN
eukprot:jgi/Chrzof1/10492/Cz05g00170.t1